MKLDILVFAAHPDDAEMACAGTIMKHIAMGSSVGIVDMTKGELGTRGTPESRAEESLRASDIMGVVIRENLGFADGFFENNREHQLQVIRKIRKFKPEIVLCNAIEDRHPDHGRAAQLVSESCFLSGLMKIETSYNGMPQQAWRPKAVYHYIQDRSLRPDFIVDISEFMERKMKAVQAYSTQFYDPASTEPATYISNPDFLKVLEGRCAEWGKHIGAKYGEGFTSEKPLGVSNLFVLK